MKKSSPQQITVPDGYKAILVPDEFNAPTPDYDECKRQADLATGLPPVSNPWINIFIREINRWCYQAYGNVFKDPDGQVNDNPTLKQLFTQWCGDRAADAISAKEAFMGACTLLNIPKMMNGYFLAQDRQVIYLCRDDKPIGNLEDLLLEAELGRALMKRVKANPPDEGSTDPLYTASLVFAREAPNDLEAMKTLTQYLNENS